MRMRCQPIRPAFTLIELLVVIALIAVMLALVAGAWFRIKTSQMEQVTNTTLSKLQSMTDAQMKAENDQAKQDCGPDGIVSPAVRQLAENDSIRTRVIWTKLRHKVAFPQNFWEVIVWAPLIGQQKYGVTQNSNYRNALAGILPTNVIDPNRTNPPLTAAEIEQLHFESAALLYMALTQPRRGQGAGFNPVDHVGANAIGDVTLYGKSFKVFIDTWRRPIAFVRWPLGSTGMDLHGPSFATTWNGAIVDPADPEMRLLRGWSTASQTAFVQNLGHSLTNPPLNLSPVIFSGGRDQLYGVDTIYTRLGSEEDDNIYGYRSRRSGGR